MCEDIGSNREGIMGQATKGGRIWGKIEDIEERAFGPQLD